MFFLNLLKGSLGDVLAPAGLPPAVRTMPNQPPVPKVSRSRNKSLPSWKSLRNKLDLYKLEIKLQFPLFMNGSGTKCSFGIPVVNLNQES